MHVSAQRRPSNPQCACARRSPSTQTQGTSGVLPMTAATALPLRILVQAVVDEATAEETTPALTATAHGLVLAADVIPAHAFDTSRWCEPLRSRGLYTLWCQSRRARSQSAAGHGLAL